MAALIVQYEFRYGTAAEWIAANPVLEIAEPGFETDTHNMKIGNGLLDWISLPYIGGTPSFPGVMLMDRFLTIEEERMGKLIKGEKLQPGPPPDDIVGTQIVKFISYVMPIPREVTDPYVVAFVNEMESTLGILDPGRAAIILTP